MTSKPLTVRQIAQILGATLEGDGSGTIVGVASLEEASPAHVTFALSDKFASKLAHSKAGAAIVGPGHVDACMPLLRVQDVQESLAKLLQYLGGGDDLPQAGVHPSAIISPDASLQEGVAVGPDVTIGRRTAIGQGSVLCAGVHIGSDVVIGQDTVLFEGVVVRWGCLVGSRVRIGPNSVIGFDGFGYYLAGGAHHRIQHIGNVVIEDDVDLGACTCVDRAKFGTTRIGRGTKIDNMVQVAHNVQVGQHCLMAAQAGIAGSTRLADYVVLGGGAGLRDGITLGKGAQCAAFAAVAQDIPDGQSVVGVPAGPVRERFREWQALSRLPQLLKTVRDMETRLRALESSKDH